MSRAGRGSVLMAAAVMGLALVAAQTARADLSYGPAVDRGDGYQYITFTAGTGTWMVPAGVSTVQVLVVGGGGSSARPDNFGSGGGAGGLYYTSSYSVGATVNITVGAGGVAAGAGGNSVFDQLIAYGGAGGGSYDNGGDQGGYSTDGGSNIIPGLAYDHSGGDYEFGSGSGAAVAGYSGNGRAGGDGVQVAITGANTYYAGGGGSCVNAAGGLGGGGHGSYTFGGPADSGVANTGGGGGGGWGGLGGDGGSGVVIVAYQAIPEPATFGMIGAAAVAMLLRRRFAK